MDSRSALMATRRHQMLVDQIERRNVRDPDVVRVMGTLPRELFVPADQIAHAYEDHPIVLGPQQTLSQPYVVAVMTEALELDGSERVLEIGTGSGYQTAILASLAKEVFTVELDPDLAASAAARLSTLSMGNVRFHVGDGRSGLPHEAPFDAILVAAAAAALPPALRAQLAPKGRLMIPLGEGDHQELKLVRRAADAPSGFRETSYGAVRFVPLR